MIFHENRLPADDSHEISCLILLFLKKRQNLKLSSAANYSWRFMGIAYILNSTAPRALILHMLMPRKYPKI